ncbi:DUF3341 domain-containing protein [bacterium]|nr:DUF3341 domain-containing protein [bacterium]
MTAHPVRLIGVLAEFETTHGLFSACEKVRDAGFANWDAHSPFPVHGLEKAMGLSRSKVGWVTLVCGLSGAAGGMVLQWWASAVAQPLVIAGKPFFSWPAFVPITFEIGVLFGALGAVFGMLHFNRLPRFHHPLFAVHAFERVTDDRFFISIDADDPKFRGEETVKWLVDMGATIHRVEEAA